MITSMLGLSATGIYTTMFNIAVVIEVPMAAIAQISQPIIAKSFATNDLETIAVIYRKSSINQQLIGSLLPGRAFGPTFTIYSPSCPTEKNLVRATGWWCWWA